MIKKTRSPHLNAPPSGWCQVILHTDQAQTLFKGNWGKRQIGVVQFATALRTLCQESNNPRAMQQRKKIQTQIQQTKQQLRQWQTVIEKSLPQHRNITFHPDAVIAKTQRMNVQFGSPEAWQATLLIIELDRLLSLMSIAQRIQYVFDSHLPTANLRQLQRHATKQIKAILHLPFQWQANTLTPPDEIQHEKENSA